MPPDEEIIKSILFCMLKENRRDDGWFAVLDWNFLRRAPKPLPRFKLKMMFEKVLRELPQEKIKEARAAI